MTVKTKFSLKGAGRDSYLKLVTAFPLASIKSDEQLQEAHKVMDQLLAQGELKGGEEMYLDALSDLVAAYEDEHYAIEPASDADMLLHLMEAKRARGATCGARLRTNKPDDRIFPMGSVKPTLVSLMPRRISKNIRRLETLICDIQSGT